MKKNSEYAKRSHKGQSAVKYQKFYPRRSKEIIDQLDRYLAKIYTFDDKELDFIIHFDERFRMSEEEEDELSPF
jgi:hypothetical protein